MLFGLCVLLCFPAAGVPAGKEGVCCDFSVNKKPLWNTVLDLPAERSEDACDWSYGYRYGTIAYTDPQRIVAGFHLECFHRSGFIPDPLRTLDMTLQIDAQTGQVLNRMEWEDVSRKRNWAGDIAVLPTHDGRFLVKVGPFLKLFSPEFKELHSRILIKESEWRWRDYWVVHVDSGGHTGFFKRWNQWSPPEDHWFSTDTLDDELAEPAPPVEDWDSVSTASSVYFYPLPNDPERSKLAYVRERGQRKAHPLCSECDGLPKAILPDGMIYLATGPKASFMLVSPQGEIIHRASYGTALDNAFHVVTASAAPRFAFSFGHLQARFFSWKSPETVAVFDTTNMRDVLQLKINQQPEHIPGGESWSQELLALSPDGTRLAVLSRAVLKVFQVPIDAGRPVSKH